jgi:hypothetical protein
MMAKKEAAKPEAVVQDTAPQSYQAALEVIAAWPLGLRSDEAQAMADYAREALDKHRK